MSDESTLAAAAAADAAPADDGVASSADADAAAPAAAAGGDSGSVDVAPEGWLGSLRRASEADHTATVAQRGRACRICAAAAAATRARLGAVFTACHWMSQAELVRSAPEACRCAWPAAYVCPPLPRSPYFGCLSVVFPH